MKLVSLSLLAMALLSTQAMAATPPTSGAGSTAIGTGTAIVRTAITTTGAITVIVTDQALTDGNIKAGQLLSTITVNASVPITGVKVTSSNSFSLQATNNSTNTIAYNIPVQSVLSNAISDNTANNYSAVAGSPTTVRMELKATSAANGKAAATYADSLTITAYGV